VLRAAVELGVSTEEVLSGEGIRKERHIESVDKARRLEFFSEMISTQPISMPRRTRDRLRRGSGGASTIGAQRSSAALVGGEHQPIAKAQESHSQGSASEASKAKRKRSFK